MNRNSKISTLLLSFLNIISMQSCKSDTSDLQAKAPEDKIEIQLTNIDKDERHKDRYVLIFAETQKQKRKLVMSIGAIDAQAIVVTTENIKPPNPLPLDILEDFITKAGYQIDEVMIDGLKDSVYTAKILCHSDQNRFWIKARTSDATILAYKFNCPIYIDKKVFDDNSI